MKFAETYIFKNDDFWRRVIFSDEKKFNLDGPDGYAYYFHDLRKEEKFLSRRQMGGGSLMIWGCIGYKKTGSICFLPTKVNAEYYKNILVKEKPSFRVISDGNPIFQQDNAPIHTAKIVKKWLSESQMETIEWPALSPDLNIIENVWGKLSRMVYHESKQYSSVSILIFFPVPIFHRIIY